MDPNTGNGTGRFYCLFRQLFFLSKKKRDFILSKCQLEKLLIEKHFLVFQSKLFMLNLYQFQLQISKHLENRSRMMGTAAFVKIFVR